MRAQNWFAVGLELVIVVVGVVIGFEVTAWGQTRADSAKEQVYLRQLSRDLAETERRADSIGRMMVPLTRAPRRFAQAHFLPQSPPRDSVLAWIGNLPVYHELSPVLGTAEALVATGDIRLIQDDLLRSAITAYLEVSQENLRGGIGFRDLLLQRANDFFIHAPIATILAESLGPAVLDSLDREDDWRVLVPPGVPLPPVDTDALVRDQQLHKLSVMVFIAKDNMGWARNQIRQSSAALREQVEAHVER